MRSPEVQREIESLYSGTTNQVELSRAAVAEMRILIAPLEEQERIIKKLDAILARLDECRGRLNQVPSIVDRFRQSILTAAITGRLTASWDGTRSQWQQCSLGSVLTDIRYGTSKKSSYEVTDGIPVLRIPNIKERKIDISDLKYAAFNENELESLSLRSGDILLVRSNGSLDLVGKAAVVDSEFEGYLFAGYLIRLRVDKTVIDPQYLCLFLLSPSVRSYIELTARSTSGVNNINSEEIRAIQLVLPSLEEQVEIVKRIEILFAYADRLMERYDAAQGQLERLMPELLAMAFRGQLVPENPSNEPASVLLQRSRARQEDEQITSMPQRPRRKPSARDKSKSKVEDIMLTRKDVGASHLSTILKARGILTAEALWSASQLEIDEFYHQLRDEEANKLLREIKQGTNNANRFLEAL